MYYLRSRKGKSARISEKIKKRIGVDVSEQKKEKEIIAATSAAQIQPASESKKENPIKGAESKVKLKKEELKKEKK